MKIFSPVSATILNISDLNENTRMFSFDCSLGAKPGQFLNIWIPDQDEKPFSVAFDDGKTLSVAIAKVGPFTEALFSKKAEDRVGIRGPFGNAFSFSGKKRVALVGGGFGAAPLFFLGKKWAKERASVSVIFGARKKDLLFYLDKCESEGFEVFATTDDGSFGEKGFVTAPLERLLAEGKIDLVQTCGPEKMMEAVAKLCEKYGIPSEISMERYMKCGFGVCGQCACGQKLVCRDGCIFSGSEALQMEDFGKFHRGAEGQKKWF